MNPLLTLSTSERRKQQYAVGLELFEESVAKNKESMQTNTANAKNPGKHGSPQLDPAARAVDAMAAALEMKATFKDIVVYELQRAAVYVPLLFASGLTLMWARRRYFG